LQSQRTFAVGSCAYSVAVGDFNGDGKLDVAVADECADTLGVLLGNGDGTLQAMQTYPLDQYAYATGVAVGDFNGDAS